MPVYAYKCKDCAHQFDVRQSFTDEPVTVCPECGGPVRKQFNSVGVVFKGAGFYRNDSRDGGKSKSAETSDSASTSSSGSSSESSKTESGSAASTSQASPAGKSSSSGSDRAGKGSSSTGTSA